MNGTIESALSVCIEDIPVETAGIRTVVNLKLPDAVHLATAGRTRRGSSVCEDRDFNTLPDGMQRIRPIMRDIDELSKDLT